MSEGVYFDSGPVMTESRRDRAVLSLRVGRCVARYPWGERGRCIMPARFRRGHWHPDDGSSNFLHLDEEGNQW